MKTVKPRHALSFFDRVSRLTFEQAARLLGPEGGKQIRFAGRHECDLATDVELASDCLRLRFPEQGGPVVVVATLAHAPDAKDSLRCECSHCAGACDHVAALLSTVLENKTALGLAAPPPERVAVEMSEEMLIRTALAEREKRARSEKMHIRSSDPKTPWADYTVESLLSGKSYRVALRGLERGESYCTCPDFRTNTLGTCKHIMKTASTTRRKFTARQLQRRYRHRRISIYLHYGDEITLRMAAPDKRSKDVDAIVRPWTNKPIDDVTRFLRDLRKLDALEQEYQIFPDAEEFMAQRLHAARMREVVAEIRRDPAKHPLRTTLLKIPLLPYQLDGVAFAVGAGRAVLADDMGLGKTIQGVGVAEMLAREADIRKVLVVCPASLKSQWRSEIGRFCDRDAQLVSGRSDERSTQYHHSCFFTICNYEQVLRDIQSIEQVPWDLIVLDEGQRIKNWESKTSRVIKGLKSHFALVLSGTPLENRLDELYSVVQFIDDRRLGPGFRFFHRHRVVDERGKVLGYQRLDQLRERLQPILLRRTRESVRLELPERTLEIVRIAPTEEQKTLHDTHMQTVAQIVRKKFLTEMDLLRLRAALLMCRMAANGTYLVNKEKPNWSSKLERLADLVDAIAGEERQKVVLFSEWTTMLDLVEPLLKRFKLPFVRLDGSVPQKKREVLVHEFQNQPQCRFFLTTNAGSTGLNLQAANTVINVDLPWNPAVLEQRIARAHRMGQKQPVQVHVLVTEQTIEENLLATLSAKKDLALAALDPDSEVESIDLVSGTEELKSRLEILLGAKGAAAPDMSHRAEVTRSLAETEQRERVAAAGGELLGALFHFMEQLVNDGHSAAPPDPMVRDLRTRLDQCVDATPDGRQRLTVTLPDRQTLDTLAHTLARLLAVGQPN
ncbi:MAG: DEAD/DEAH box helicase [Pirellulales bacterium]|nr:DEAD/DEAH box helicase [Pirellulales bacterium]